jgi:hypothetical protein
MLSAMRTAITWLVVLVTVNLFAAAQSVSPAQSSASDDIMLAKTRSLYDAPFTRGLISFDCAVQFDWTKHFVDLYGTVPAVAAPTIKHLQSVQHRVFVDGSGAIVSAIPKAPDLTTVEHGSEIEQAFTKIVSASLDTWLPFGTNVILPVKPTKFSFERVDTGYALTLHGPGVSADLQLTVDMRLTSGVSQEPQPLHFSTTFTQGPDGFLLSSIRTGNTLQPAQGSDATFEYAYQPVQGFQIPSSVTVIAPTNETWNYNLTDCKSVKGILVNVGPSPKLETEHKQ